MLLERYAVENLHAKNGREFMAHEGHFWTSRPDWVTLFFTEQAGEDAAEAVAEMQGVRTRSVRCTLDTDTGDVIIPGLTDN